MNNSKIYTIEKEGGKDIVKFAKKYGLKEKLSNIRMNRGNRISNEIFFKTTDEVIINFEDENDFTLEDIINGKIMHMKYLESKKKLVLISI